MKKSGKKLIVIGDRVLVDPDEGKDKTSVGLYLPQTVREKEQIQSGQIIATGPGLPLPDPQNIEDEPWRTGESRNGKHIPMQARVGDSAIFLKKASIEIQYNEHTYLVVPQSALLVLLRDDVPFRDIH